MIPAQASYLPPDSKLKFNTDSCNFFLEKAKTSGKELSQFCIEKAIHFLHAKEHLEKMASLVSGDCSDFSLTADQKLTVCKLYHASADFTQEQKDKIKEQVMADNKSEEAILT